MVQKALTTKEKIDILNFSKTKNFCLEKDMFKILKRNTQRKKIYIYKKWLIFRIHKELR